MRHARRILAFIFLVIGKQLRALDRALATSARHLLEGGTHERVQQQRNSLQQPQPFWSEGALDPPEHWLERVREGAPSLLDQLPITAQVGVPKNRSPATSGGRKPQLGRSQANQLTTAIRRVAGTVERTFKSRPSRPTPARSAPAQRPRASAHRRPVVPPRRLRGADREWWPAAPDTSWYRDNAVDHPQGALDRTSHPIKDLPTPSHRTRASEPPHAHSNVNRNQASDSATHHFRETPRLAPEADRHSEFPTDWQAVTDTPHTWPRLPDTQGGEFEGWSVEIRRWERLRRLDAEQRGESWNEPPS